MWTSQRMFNQQLQHYLLFLNWLEAVHKQLEYCLGHLSHFKFHTKMAEKESDILIQDTYFKVSTISFWLAPPHPPSGGLQGSQQKRSAHHKTMLFGSWTGCHASMPVHGSTKNLICENTALSRCPAQTMEETSLGTTDYLHPPHLPLHDLSLSIRSTQQHTGVGKKPKHPFKKCTSVHRHLPHGEEKEQTTDVSHVA